MIATIIPAKNPAAIPCASIPMFGTAAELATTCANADPVVEVAVLVIVPDLLRLVAVGVVIDVDEV